MFGVVSVPVQSFVLIVKRIGDRTVPCGELVEIEWDKKVDNPILGFKRRVLKVCLPRGVVVWY